MGSENIGYQKLKSTKNQNKLNDKATYEREKKHLYNGIDDKIRDLEWRRKSDREKGILEIRTPDMEDMKDNLRKGWELYNKCDYVGVYNLFPDAPKPNETYHPEWSSGRPIVSDSYSHTTTWDRGDDVYYITHSGTYNREMNDYEFSRYKNDVKQYNARRPRGATKAQVCL